MKVPSHTNSLVYLDAVSKIYPTATGDYYGVRDVTLDVQPGEFYSLLGPSGSGKTTTLRMIGGFEIPEYGEVYIDGQNVTELPPYRRDVHTVFQNYALFPHLTVAENIAYPLRLAGVSRSDIEPRLREVLQLVQIPTLGDRKPAQLSGGQQQRVALARALVDRPKVLLLDEPLSALDAQIREALRQELRQLQRKTEITFVYVTHDQEEALALSDRIAVMHNGRIEQIGTPSAIYNRPASTFVAQFIGQANFLTGKVIACSAEDETTGTAIVEVNNMHIKALSLNHTLAVESEVTLMVRPERISTHVSNADNSIGGKLIETTYTGQRIELIVETAIGQLKMVRLSDHQAMGETLKIGWNREDCIVLPTTLPTTK
ncbi:ABC transporter ATP-binding protein [Leptothoe sp. PORK10 BA2]|uniref:ABC transporter ATP-binding protein n=1 Tax=Leptothoe sp. PORK10 BA2 TaxID=3110254 RepID=UPI002B211007|nr:ABC transporter ATP-binding protein [Leptothoe sp. PORK10 BA2]MEA5466929.1 ABC transporter ATP-binding protein [Leptothoe sp. PORK10 BA2]